MPKVLITYATLSGQTQNIAELIAEGVRFTGAEAKVLDAKALPNPEDLAGYDAVRVWFGHLSRRDDAGYEDPAVSDC